MEILSKLFGKKTTVHKTEKPFEKMTQAEKLHDVAVYIQANAEDGDAQCQFDYGMMLVSGTGPHGHGVYRQNEDAGIQWLKKSAQQGHEQAQAMLGKIYADRGNGAEAVKFYHMASEQGHIDATINLAMMYGSGDVVTKDSEKAHILFLKAANQGDPFAQYIVGLNYFHGEGSEENTGEAIKWFSKAAEQGEPHAQFEMGQLCEYGANDLNSAKDWYSKAAKQGHKEAAMKLQEIQNIT